ncbi:Hypothetical protein SCLAV_p0641 (plasmid) [Streptomyces clavuligerus]|uniref:Uncharacterized protein n=2 Tax=Streptomyces clavuligerus TaxID=1901 RepID=B5GTR2_STRCL|nr:hypothetical protein SSCG_02810 [Streptomyces clavuligerus]EFG04128.1 Hypothetical protein SCLAV_p0641 [Streptomyces clavuligerus]
MSGGNPCRSYQEKERTMENHDLDLLARLHALPETDPVGVDGEAFANTCACVGLLTLLNSVCIGITC